MNSNKNDHWFPPEILLSEDNEKNTVIVGTCSQWKYSWKTKACNGGDGVEGGSNGIWELFVLFTQFCCDPKTALLN